MPGEKPRVMEFDVVALDDNDWDGPHPQGEFLSYTSKHGACSLRVTKDGATVFDADFGAKKTVLIDDDVIHIPEGAGPQEKRNARPSEKPRIMAFGVVALDDNDWDGPHPQGEFLTYTSKHGACSLEVTKDGATVFDADFGARKTILIDDDVIHIPEGAGPQERR